MNNELQAALAEFVNRAIALVDAGTAQLPAVLQDIVAYKLFDAYFDTGAGILLLVISLVSFITSLWVDWDNIWEVLGKFVGVAGGAFGLILFLGGIYQAYYVTHFPRLVILDYLRGLL